MRLRDEAARWKNKRPSFDPAQLNWIPRKRHNTRWPINPPAETTAFIAKLQPLIKFELHPSQIDEAACFEPEENGKVHDGQQTGAQEDRVPQSPRIPEPEEPAQQVRKEKPGRRRRTLRLSLGTISEATDETLLFPMLTPTANRVIHVSPTKRWQAAADKSKTPTKVAETPMKNFTMAATSNTGNITINSPSGQPMIPSSPTPMDDASGRTSVDGYVGHNRDSSAIHEKERNEGLLEHDEDHGNTFCIVSPDKTDTTDERSSTYVTALPFFDQPIPDVQVEPKHESRRRISLNNARHSDRTSDIKMMKRVHKWMAGATLGKKRRHSDIGALHQPVVAKRRHTLDVDAGMNPDIFGQLKVIPPSVGASKKPMEILHERSEASVGDTTSAVAISVEPPAQDVDLTVPEEEAEEDAIESNLENIGNEYLVSNEENSENEDEDDNVEGDSDMTYLQNFVQRSKSNKEEKRGDVPSAPLLIKSFAKKRRSGSMNSATSDAGSPMAKMATTESPNTNARPRMPLGEKDANKSPSPSKKRKLKAAEDGSVPIKKKSGRLVAPDLDDIEPATTKRKKRRKGIESDTDDVFNPAMDFNQVLTQRSSTSGSSAGGGPARRSTRIATTQKPDPAPINVRLPGGVFVDNGDIPIVSTAGITNAVLQRKADQDLANKTKANTRKNRGGAVPVQMVLASMAERSGDSDADDLTLTTTLFMDPKVGRSGIAKTVRWDEILARTQSDGETVAIDAAAAELEENKAGVESNPQPERADEEDTHLPSPPQLRVVDIPDLSPGRPGNPVANQLATNSEDQDEVSAKIRQAPIRRSSRAATVSRLPKRGGVVSIPANAPPTPALTPKPKRSSLPAPSRLSKSGGGRGGAAAGAADARARLGMAGPGTPAPRRGGRRGGRRV